MTCINCEDAQKQGLVAYYRVHIANVGITGCRPHVKAVMDVLRNHSDELDKLAKE